MLTQIATYFAKYRKVILPGIGSLTANRQTASVEFVERTIHAPVYTIQYVPADSDLTDNTFISFLSRSYRCSTDDAAEKLNDFAQQAKSILLSGNTFNLPGIGAFKINEGGALLFEQSRTVNSFYKDLAAEKVIRKNASHTVRVGEDEKTSEEMHAILHESPEKSNWWIAAVILGVVGIAAILYYYLVEVPSY